MFDPCSREASLLTERRKADRKKMVEALSELCDHHKIPYSVDWTWADRPNCILFDIKGADGLSLGIDLDTKSCQPDVFVLCWHMNCLIKDRIIDPEFGPDINPYHFRKASEVCRGFVDLYTTLEKRLQCMADGKATKLDK